MWSGPGTVIISPSTPWNEPTAGVGFTTLVAGVNPAIDAGVRAFASGDYETARRAFAEAVADDPDDPYGLILYGWSWFAMGEYSRAVRAIHQTLTATPEIVSRPPDITPLYGDRTVLTAQIERLARESELAPPNSDLKFLLAYVLFVSEQPQAALKMLTRISGPAATDPVVRRLRETLQSLLSAPMEPTAEHSGQFP